MPQGIGPLHGGKNHARIQNIGYSGALLLQRVGQNIESVQGSHPQRNSGNHSGQKEKRGRSVSTVGRDTGIFNFHPG